MMTVDANVWVAAYDPHDRFHRDSVAFLSAVLERRFPLVAPAIMPLEAACALARRAGRSEVGVVAFDRLQRVPGLRLLPVDAPLLSVATGLGAQALLRGADALYAAAAKAAGGTLISWDAELIERGGVQAPTDWLAQHT